MIIQDAKGMYEVKVDTKRRIVYEYVTGLWQAEDYKRLHNEYVTKIGPLLGGKPWAKLSELKSYKTSNITDEINKHVSWSAKNGLEKAAIVVESSIIKMQMKKSGSGVMEPEIFTDEKSADDWLKSQGF
ncbi:hypothetical protein KQI42_08670 [Tissierella sp. MSJ-40]|uniref:STAS/SEC14 domain-containing protein n=1 Tax=Tissierella simiarum TaxID=2841534 RepID=A0ABS6E575_9FIRM|nr:hypothetical protein [Tissierella simiarum]MBU5438078.1 hypothetical protein [Tissierella simiarum]